MKLALTCVVFSTLLTRISLEVLIKIYNFLYNFNKCDSVYRNSVKRHEDYIELNRITADGSTQNNKGVRFASSWIDAQIALIEGTIIFIGGIHEDLNTFLREKNHITPVELRQKQAIVKKAEEIENRTYDLLLKNSHAVNDMLTFMLSDNYSEIDGPIKQKQMAQNIVKRMTEFSDFFFTYMPTVGLFNKMDRNFNEDHVRKTMEAMDPLKRTMNQKLSNISKNLGMDTPIFTHGVTPNKNS